METSPPTVTVLPQMREALGADMPIIVDGGITRSLLGPHSHAHTLPSYLVLTAYPHTLPAGGTHIAKALALGANAVGIGRAYLYGLAAGGTPGVSKAVAILKRELDIAMGLLGVASVDELRARGPELVRARGGAAVR